MRNTAGALLALCCAGSIGCAQQSSERGAQPSDPVDADSREETAADTRADPGSDWQARVDAEARRLSSEHPGADVRIFVASAAGDSLTALAAAGETSSRAPTGSTFKPITVLAALRLGLDPQATLDCSGSVKVGELSIQDYTDHGTITVSEVVAKSSNVGIVRIAERVGAEALYEEVAKLVPLPAREGLDDATAMTTIIGLSARLSLEELAGVYRTVTSDPDHGAAVMGMLRAAVGPDGTGDAGWVDGVTTGGKTGTAAHDGQHDALFVGLADVDAGPVIIAISVAGVPTSNTGGGVAAPAFARLLAPTAS